MTKDTVEARRLRANSHEVVLASIGDGVITTDVEGRITLLNVVAEALCGWSVKDAMGQPLESVFRILDQDSREPVESSATRVLRDGTAVVVAKRRILIAKDGTERPIDCSAAPIRHKDGKVAGAVQVFRDVSERRQSEQKAEDALAYAQNIIATLREPFVVLDKGLHVVTANCAFYRTFRVTKVETEGKFIYDLGNGQWNIPRLRTLLDGVLQNFDAVHDFEVEHTFPAIGTKIMLLNTSRFASVEGSQSLLLLAIEDITEHKRAEVALQASESRYRRLFQTAKDGILILDIDTQKIVDANPFMTELLEYTYEEIVGKELWQLGFFRDKTASQVAYKELNTKGYIRYDHLPLETRKGQTAEVEFVSSVYQVDGKNVAQCNVRDISVRSRMENKMRRKDEFLAMLSHELRNPLAPILNAVLLLRLQGRDNPIQQQAVGIIERQVGQLRHIVDDLLEVARITTGRVQLRQEVITAGSVVSHAIETARPLVKQHRHELTVAIPPEPISVNGDAARLEQVVVNLLTNAVKYTGDGGHIWVTVGQEDEECVIRVRDNGVGIALDALPNIFDLFTQGARSLDRSQGGLGIGLALAQQLVEMHGGRIEAHSRLGSGSEFVVRLPVVVPNALAAALPHVDKTRAAGRSLRVLVVEDNVDTARSLTMLLEASGHNVRNSFDGLTALEEALEYRPNVVLLDIGLPGLDGYKVAKWMRHTLKDVMLVAVTGYGQDADRQRSKDAGFNHHLVKPADYDSVLQILATVPESVT